MKFIFFLVIVLICPLTTLAQTLSSDLNAITKQTNGLAITVFDLTQNKVVYTKNSDTPLKPASVMKLLTSYAALDTLGAEYRFRTNLYAQNRNNNYIESLYIVGSGDPNLTTEQLWLIVRALKRKGITTINNVYLDDSVYKTVNVRTGERAYQAGNSGLAFNFNSITFELCTNSNPIQVNIDPWEYRPTLSGQIKGVHGRAKGYGITEIASQDPAVMSYKLAGELALTNSCLENYRSVEKPLEYLKAVLKSYFNLLGIKVENIQAQEQANIKTTRIYTHSSKTLSQIIEDMNLYSNNFIAEQIVVSLDRTRTKHKTREQGLKVLQQYANKFAHTPTEYNIVDASGLSHDNRLSTNLLTNLLVSAYNSPALVFDFIKSLPVGGYSGTLKKRKLSFQNGVIRAKTGTIDGVSSLAGYILRKDKKYAFAIIQNSGLSHLNKHQLEERIVKVLFTR